MCHNNQVVMAVSKEPNPTRYQKTLGVNDFYFKGPSTDYPLGNISMVGKSQAPMFRGEKHIAKLAPLWSLEMLAKHGVDFWLCTEDLPRPENRVTLEPDGSIRLSYTKTNEVPTKQLADLLKSMLGHLGMHPEHLVPRNLYLKNEMEIGAVAHQAGTVRFGTDPKTSVLDVNCKAHELDNLYVVDTSFFPSIGAVNPGLTAMANALRVGDHLRQRLG
jgi:choline dehydrogenase-like flavoprotein